MHLLLTGFYDWRDLGAPPLLDRCRDNPSCRLTRGPLLPLLNAEAERRGHTLKTHNLPVTWGAAERLDLSAYDAVAHLGLGIYDRHDELWVEEGAWNERRGVDAAGLRRDERITEGADALPPTPRAAARLRDLHTLTLPQGFRALPKPARPSNAYLCNETHFRALTAAHARAPSARPLDAYFVHIPYAPPDVQEVGEGERALAEAVAALVGWLWWG
jgi:hypothetical protein